jgi:hypothetical protein
MAPRLQISKKYLRTRNTAFSKLCEKLPCVSYLDGFPVGAGLPELYVL